MSVAKEDFENEVMRGRGIRSGYDFAEGSEKGFHLGFLANRKAHVVRQGGE